jgi:hypothetical protein
MINLSKETKLQRVSNAVAAGTSTVTSSSVDMKGYENCLFVVAFGAIVSGGVQSVKVQQSSDDGSTDAYSDLEGTSVSVADNNDNQLVYVEIARPTKRYLKCIVSRATQNSTVDAIIAVLSGNKDMPTTHDATTVLGGETHVSPEEGTA